MAFTKRYSTTVESYNETTYTVEIWDNVTTSVSANDFKIDTGFSIDYNGDTNDKYNPIITSKCKLPFIVQSGGDANFINQLRSSSYSEKDVYVYIYKGSDLIWGGFILLELGKEEDLAYPYTVNLCAVDGIALSKNLSFVPDVALFPPFDIADTFMESDPQTFIYWLKTMVSNIGFPTTTQGASADYNIKTAVDWYNEEHSGTTATDDPLALTRCTVEMMYNEIENDNWADYKYEANTIYSVLEYMCITWGMRMIYWGNTVFFIQISQYKNSESGTFLAPINITTRTYDKNGTFVSAADDIGTTNLAYDLDFEGSGANGLQKLSGTTYDFSTPIKQVKSNFLSFGNYNYHVAFPRIFNEGIWDASLTTQEVITEGEIINIKNPALADSFFTQIFLNINNTGGKEDLLVNFTIRAKPKGSASWTYMLKSGASNLFWDSYTAPTGGVVDPVLGVIDPSSGGVLAFCKKIELQSGSSTINIMASQIGGGAIPTDSAFTGVWTFQWIAYAKYNQPSGGMGQFNVGTLNGHGGIVSEFIQYTGMYFPFFPAGFSGFTDDIFINEATMTNMNYPVWHPNWSNQGQLVPAPHNPNVDLSSNYFCQVKNGAIGVQNVEDILSLNDNSYVYKVKKLFWGDVDVDTVSALEVYDGANWVLTDASGKWGVQTTSGNFNFSTLLCQEILNNGAVTSYKFSGTSVLSVNSKEETDGSGTRLKYVNPIGRLVDQNGNFVFASGTFDLLSDQVDLEMFEINYTSTSPTTTQTNHIGPHSGSVGLPQNNTPNLGMAINPPNTNITVNFPVFQVFGNINVTSSPITSITVAGSSQAIFKTGDVFDIVDRVSGTTYEITLAADYVPPAQGTVTGGTFGTGWAYTTTITINSLTLNTNIYSGSKIGLSTKNLITEYQRKTMGTVGGFAITSETIGGWNSRTGTFVGVDMDYIKLIPSDFIPNDNKVNRSIYFDDSGTTGVRIQDATQELWAFRQVPYGKKVTYCNVWGNATRDVEVYVLNVDSSGVGSTIGTGSTGATGFSVTDTSSDATNYIGVKVITTAMSDRIYGGKLLISDI